MLKQLPNRNHRTKGFKAKQGFKIFTLIVVGIWLLYKLKQYSHDKKQETSAKIHENLKAGSESKNLGRKGLEPWSNDKLLELLEDTEENEQERDDSIVGHDGERIEEEESEEVEDLIDEQDKEREEQNEDEDGEDMGNQMEDMQLLENEDDEEGEKDTQSKSEKHNKETDASRVVMRMTKSLGSEFGGLKKVEEEEVGNSEMIETQKAEKGNMNSSKVISQSSNQVLKWWRMLELDMAHFQMSYLQKE
ncbi:hypothetical protein VNO80_18355 [Phaseolus coccineus]|uniref:Uncharacterized protein n=1 Tax=Phaseolus coccineus TaxID=3886 RepID=A0AAN9QZG0_PHACN